MAKYTGTHVTDGTFPSFITLKYDPLVPDQKVSVFSLQFGNNKFPDPVTTIELSGISADNVEVLGLNFIKFAELMRKE